MAEDNTTPENSSEDTNQTEAKSGQTQTKNNQALIKKILIITAAILVILLCIIITVFLTHSAKEEAVETTIPVETTQPIQASQTNTETTVNQTPTIQNTQTAEPKDTTFDFNNLDPEELNEQLALLTNKSMIQEAEELKNNNTEEQKEEDIVSLSPQDFQNKIEELKPTNKGNNEQNTSLKEPQQQQQATQENTNENQNNTNNSVESTKQEENTINNQPLPFVKLINVAKIKGKLYKKYFDKAILVNPNILLCRDEDNNIELYYVLLDDKLRDELLSKLLKQGFTEAYILDMLEDEFNKRCKY